MSDFFVVVAYALLPALGNLAGGLLAETMRTPRWVIGAALHGAAGIAIALISIDLMPRILLNVPMWGIALAFLGGAATSFFLARGVAAIRGEASGSGFRAWMVYAAIGADLMSDGAMTGAGSAVALNLGLLLAAAQSIANIPGGFAAAANLRSHGVPRQRRILTSLAMFAPVLLSAAAGFIFLQGTSEIIKSAVLAYIVGLLLLATVEDMIPEGDAPRPPRWSSTLAFALGFAGLSLSSRYLG
ncbi:ZIP family metal transporter [Hyphococcus sp.]|uniref:ZIP family metal transporter n=1 Tax=Hyphococcus sp. TaxID=2038636 RepID=UPI003CCB9364